jgi:hypothetical protein
MHSHEHILHTHLRSAVKRVSRVAPRAAQIAPRQTHKNARQPRARAFSLNRFEYFYDEHDFLSPGLAAWFPLSRRLANITGR